MCAHTEAMLLQTGTLLYVSINFELDRQQVDFEPRALSFCVYEPGVNSETGRFVYAPTARMGGQLSPTKYLKRRLLEVTPPKNLSTDPLSLLIKRIN